MFPEEFAQAWIERLAKPGAYVLDPFCGRGTTPFQAILMKRRAIACDVNPVAYCITKAKTRAPVLAALLRRITILEHSYRYGDWESKRRRLPEFFRYAYCASTLRQLLYLRENLRWYCSKVDCMIGALVLGALHGETNRSKNYLSNQMPRTISTKPRYSIKFWKQRKFKPPERDVFELLRHMASYRYESEPPKGKALVFHADMRKLPLVRNMLPKSIKCVITSPPYLNVTNFEEDQWLRLWFLGGPPRPTYGRISRDDRYEAETHYWRFIADFWRVLGTILDKRADIVIRLGSRGVDPERVVSILAASSRFARRKVALLDYEVSSPRRRQTDTFRPGTEASLSEVDCHFAMIK